VRELLGVPLGTPERVVAVLPAAAAVDAGGLDVAERVGRDPDVAPRRRDGQLADAPQLVRGRHAGPVRVAVGEAAVDGHAPDAGTVDVAADEAGGQPAGGVETVVHDLGPNLTHP
jgi:hypothetical protein